MKPRRFFLMRLTLTILTLLGNLFPIFNLFTSPTPTFAIDQTNTPATLMLGQTDFERGGAANGGDLSRGLYYPYPTVFAGGKLLIPDYYNNRVLVYNSLPVADYSQPDLVLGQVDLYQNGANQGQSELNAGTLSYPQGAYTDGTRLVVADSNNTRVLIWNTFPTEDGQEADLVLGQPDFTSGTANNGGIDAGSLYIPTGITIDDDRLIVADTYNNRVLVWNTFPAENNQDADLVLGQPDFTSNDANNGGIGAGTLYRPYSVKTDGTQLTVADFSNNRVLIWSTFPTENGQDADLVLGQPDFESNTANNGGIDAGSLYSPRSVSFDGDKFAVAEFSNNRVLIWNTFPTENNQDADLVLGQPDFTSNTGNNGGLDAGSIYYANGVYTDGTRLITTEWANNRVLIWNTFPTENNQDADLVLGQADFTTGSSNFGAINSSSFYDPYGIVTDGTRVVVSDRGNNRVLIWNTFPTENNQDADLVLGQADFITNDSNAGGLDAGSIYQPFGVAISNDRLILADGSNNRVLIWNTWPTENNQDADLVLGQPDFTTRSSNYGGRDAGSLYVPYSVSTDGTKLVVGDDSNHRVLIWNTWPTENGQEADLVLGQPSFTTGSSNYGGLDAGSLYYPDGVYTDGERIVVTDWENNRVLIWNTWPTENGQEADLVLGQPDFSIRTANYGGLDAGSFYRPSGVSSDGTRLLVSDYVNSRALLWNTWPTENNQDADVVFGQPDFESNTLNNGGRSARTIHKPYGDVFLTDDWLVVVDRYNNRVLLYPTGPQNTSLAVGGAFQGSSSSSLTLGADDAKQMKISTDSSFTGIDWSDYATSYPWTLSTEGNQTVYAKLRDWANYETTLSISFNYDAAPPNPFTLLSPAHEEVVCTARPIFSWRAANLPDDTSELDHYKLEVRYANGGGFIADNLPVSSFSLYQTERYKITYEGFADSDTSNNTFSFISQDSPAWGGNNGLLQPGNNLWLVTAVDRAGNERTEQRWVQYSPDPTSCQTSTQATSTTLTTSLTSSTASSSASLLSSLPTSNLLTPTPTADQAGEGTGDNTGDGTGTGAADQPNPDESTNQPLTTLTVQVLDQNLTPVPNARVVLTSTPREDYTDDHGWVTFNHVEPGEHLLTFYYANQTGTQPVTVQPGTTELKVTAKLELEEENHWLIWGLGGVLVITLVLGAFLVGQRKKSDETVKN